MVEGKTGGREVVQEKDAQIASLQQEVASSGSDSQQQQIASLEQQNAALEARLAALEAANPSATQVAGGSTAAWLALGGGLLLAALTVGRRRR